MMAVRSEDLREAGHRLGAAVRGHWVLFLTEGMVLVILGILALLAPVIASVAATVFFGWLLLVSGIVGLVTTFRARHAPGFWWSLVSALIGIVAGIFGGWALIFMALHARPTSAAVAA
jgi:uncharacterized membrane protein HdeD (DUF308 family)